ncbi:MAG TPA: hypothetical protein VKB38_04530 [Terracidiphilus sp.]|nr:hypothetical protein [Terracidiphilus sp.]
MPLQTEASPERLEERSPGIIKEWVRPIFISIIGGIIAGIAVGVAQYMELKKIEHNIQAEKDQRLLGLQGVWLLETRNRSATMTRYEGLQVQYIAVIAVDSNFNVQGTAYKVREKDKDAQSEKEYKRDERSRSTLHGTLVQNQLTLLFDTENAQGLPSFQTIEAQFHLGHPGPRIAGSFSDEVGSQNGEVCGRKLLDARTNGENWFSCD